MAKTETVLIRVREMEKTAWTEAAASQQMSLSEYIRWIVNREVERRDTHRERR